MKHALACLATLSLAGCFDFGEDDASAADPAAASPAVPPAPEFKVTATSPALTKELVEVLAARPMADVDYDKVDALVRQGLDEVRGSIEAAIDKQENVDYDRIHSLILRTVVDNLAPVVDNLKPVEPPKYQFMCDPNERLIYRCNLQTGQIECFSMSANKIRPLSSYP